MILGSPHSSLVHASPFIRLTMLLKCGPLNNTVCVYRCVYVCVLMQITGHCSQCFYTLLFSLFLQCLAQNWNKGSCRILMDDAFSCSRLRCDDNIIVWVVSVCWMLRPVLRPVSPSPPNKISQIQVLIIF